MDIGIKGTHKISINDAFTLIVDKTANKIIGDMTL